MAEPRHHTGSPLWGVAAEFETAEGMCAALLALRDRGLGRLEAYSPVPVPAAADALRLADRPVYPLGVAGALFGGAAFFAICAYATVYAYPLDIGGRPLLSWPSYVVPSVSAGALVGAMVVFFAMLTLNRMPRLNHPAFNIPNFTRATADRYFVAVEARDDDFDPDAVEAAIAALAISPGAVRRVPR